MSQRSQVSRIAPLGCSLMEVGRWVGMLVGRSFFSHIMSLRHSDQMSQRSQVSCHLGGAGLGGTGTGRGPSTASMSSNVGSSVSKL